MSIGVSAILDRVISYASSSGRFDNVQGHEPKSAPGHGLTCAVWVETFGPATSGLNATSARLLVFVRLYQNFMSQPEDAIDPNLIDAADALMASYIGDLTLGGLVKSIDVRGADGPQFECRAGYQQVDKGLYRVLTISLPIVKNDVWTETQ